MRRLVVGLLLLCASAVGAQGSVPDSTCLRVGRVASDSLAKLHLASTTLTAYQTRALRRLDSLHVARCVTPAPLPPPPPPPPTAPDSSVASVVVGFAWLASEHYNNPANAHGWEPWPVPPADTVTVCGTVHWPDSTYSVASPPLRFRTLGDSARAGFAGGNPMAEMCGSALAIKGLSATAPTVPVAWDWRWVPWNGRRLFRPFPRPTVDRKP